MVPRLRRVPPNAKHSDSRRRIRAALALGVATRSSATAQALAGAAVAAIALSGVGGCSFHSAPGVPSRDVAGDVQPAGDGGAHLVDAGAADSAGDVGAYVKHIERDGHTYVLLDGGVYELQRSDAGTVSFVEVDAGGALEPDASSSSSSSSSTTDAGALEPTDAGTPAPARKLCSSCSDGTFKCPSSASSTGFVCRSWPPCYCNGDGGTQ